MNVDGKKSYEIIAQHVFEVFDHSKLRHYVSVETHRIVAWVHNNKNDWVRSILEHDEIKIIYDDVPMGESIDELILSSIKKLLEEERIQAKQQS